jgi:hypothetical protein
MFILPFMIATLAAAPAPRAAEVSRFKANGEFVELSDVVITRDSGSARISVYAARNRTSSETTTFLSFSILSCASGPASCITVFGYGNIPNTGFRLSGKTAYLETDAVQNPGLTVEAWKQGPDGPSHAPLSGLPIALTWKQSEEAAPLKEARTTALSNAVLSAVGQSEAAPAKASGSIFGIALPETTLGSLGKNTGNLVSISRN